MSDVQRLEQIRASVKAGWWGCQPDKESLAYLLDAYDALARQFEELRADTQLAVTTGLNMAEKGEKAMAYIEQLERQLAEYHADHNERMEHIQRLNKELAETQQRIATMLDGERQYQEQVDALVTNEKRLRQRIVELEAKQ